MDGKTIKIYGLPNTVTAIEVKKFLEKHVSKGSVAAIKVRHQEDSERISNTLVVVQFLTSKLAKKITWRARQGHLKYKTFVLTTKSAERAIVPQPRIPWFTLEGATLHLGCPISSKEFSVLCIFNDVKVDFGASLRKIYFFILSGSQSYKLELSYESIWEIKLLRCHKGRKFHKGKKEEDKKFLLVQVQAAPRIYEVPGQNSGILYEDAHFNYFKDIPDDMWIRTTDFTPSCSIGQSSAFCLQLPNDCNLPNIQEYFVYYQEVNHPFHLLKGSSFSRSLDLVPIVEPSPGIEVPYRILFKINHMVQIGTLMGPTLNDKFYKLVSPHSELPINYIERALEDMSYLKSSCLNPATWLQEKYKEFQTSNRVTKSSLISLDSGLVYVHRVQVTPCKVYFYGPEINVSNGVIRHFSKDIDNFIRVSFVDEDGEKMFSTDLSPRSGNDKRTAIYQRILSTIRNGICIGEKKFEFLAFSSSQLSENSAWMFASRPGLTAADVRKWLGDFRKIRNVAKYAARLGQYFSSSTETLIVHSDEVKVIPDVENSAGHLFSDGIGKISTEFARAVAEKCRRTTSTPSAFQIRYGGYKGVVAVDPTSSMKLSLRKSMSKYESENNKLDVLAYSKYRACYLNRQLITLLSTLGVGDDVFESKQTEAVERLDKILEDPANAREAIEMMSQGETTNVLNEMLSCGYKPDAEPFLSMLLQTFRATKLLELRTRSRIFIPKGRSLMGCLDETRTLDYGEVFVQVSLSRNKHVYDDGLSEFSGSALKSGTAVVRGKVIVAKNPCLHPGDIRVLQAVDVLDLHHMVDCVVFPQMGKRPHPNECSGSDLDGDIYFVSWDPMLIPPCQDEPMDYTPAKPVILNNDVTIEEVQEYFVNYMLNDSLGVISNAHTVFADKEPLKARSEECLELARLFSIAVDFPKTGVPAEIPPNLHVKEYPDFMEKLDKVTYISEGVIGKLFRQIKGRDPNSCHIKAFTKEAAEQCYDKDMEVDGFKEHVNDASFFKNEYDTKLGNLMDYYEIKTEGEILSGSIMKASKSFNRYKDGEAVMLAVRSLKKEAREWFNEKSHDHGDDEDEAFAKASAWYHVTYHPDYWGIYNKGLNRPHFLSFPWCVYDKLTMIKQKNMRMRRAVEFAPT
ncbi:RNA-directed RNA polymerase protein [Dioscorea alata]|nr:RNA-directed RNA polymerase protein [Dioscorea alata]KAH7656050.1 RNA-directed RNA polymerase protein [Dioscorea alata]